MRVLPSVLGLTRAEIEELRDALVRGSQKLVVDLRVHDVGHDLEPVPREELDLEGEAEDAAQAQLQSAVEQRIQQTVAQSRAPLGVAHRERPDLGEVLPHHVEGSAADDHALVIDGDQELLDGLVVGDQILPEQDPGVGHRLDQPIDPADVSRQRRADGEGHTGLS